MSDYVRSLERGIAVIRSFSEENDRLTLSEVSRLTGLTRATARRLLLTLVDLGYVHTDGKHFTLTPRVLDIGYSFVSSFRIPDIAQPYLEALSETVHESSSVSVLDETDIVYVARVPTTRIMTVAIGLGSRFPAFQTSMGRVLLAELADDAAREIFVNSDVRHRTPHTITGADELIERLAEVRTNGYALVDQELEIGVRSLAAPLRDATGRAVAAVNVSTHVGRTDMRQLRSDFLPHLLDTASQISNALAMR